MDLTGWRIQIDSSAISATPALTIDDDIAGSRLVRPGTTLGAMRSLLARGQEQAPPQAFDLADEALLGARGHPIGVRLRFKVRFEHGLDDTRLQPVAGLHIPSPPANMVMRDWAVTPPVSGKFPAGEYLFTQDFIPDFLPKSMRFPSSPQVADDQCFYWGNEAHRLAATSDVKQQLEVSIMAYDIRQLTSSSYALHDFYLGAMAEGAHECARIRPAS